MKIPLLCIASVAFLGCDSASEEASAPQATACTNDVQCVSVGQVCQAGFCALPTDTTRLPLDDVAVPAGTFWMGCDSATDQACTAAEGPRHEVTTGAYRIDRTEVTVRAFADFMAVNGNACAGEKCVRITGDGASVEEDADGNWKALAGRAKHPIGYVTWHGAKAFCEWRGQTLCTEAQWAKAATGGCDVHGTGCQSHAPTYIWGDEEPTCDRVHMTDPAIAGQGCGKDDSAEVGTHPKAVSPYGVEDMAGNVWEWTLDAWHDGFEGAPTDGSAWSELKPKWYTYRGGGAASTQKFLRVAYRFNAAPEDSARYRGVRCCRSQ